MSVEAGGVLDNKDLVANGIPCDLTGCRRFEVPREVLDALATTNERLTEMDSALVCSSIEK